MYLYYLDNSSIFEQYAIAFYWAVVTTTQVGYGDIIAYTHAEVCDYACIVFLPTLITLRKVKL